MLDYPWSILDSIIDSIWLIILHLRLFLWLSLQTNSSHSCADDLMSGDKMAVGIMCTEYCCDRCVKQCAVEDLSTSPADRLDNGQYYASVTGYCVLIGCLVLCPPSSEICPFFNFATLILFFD